MTDETQEDAAPPEAAKPSAEQQNIPTGPKMWPAVLIVAALIAAFAWSFQAPTLILKAVGSMISPILAMILLTVWWLRSKGVPRNERIRGLILFVAVLAWIWIAEGAMGGRIIMIAIPTLITGIVILLFMTAQMPWSIRRTVAVAFMLVCAAVFTALRVDDVRGDLIPVMSWRWELTPDERFAAVVDPHGSESHGTAALPPAAGPQDWPEFRVPARDSRLPGTTFATDWNDNPPRELWRRPVGLGWASFSVVGDYIFTQEQRGSDELVVCYHADTGDQVWTNSIPARFDDAMGSGPRATPTFHQGRLYTFGATGILQCLDAATGKTLWKRDLKEDTGAALPVWGFSSSPLVTGDRVIVFSGGPNGKSASAYHLASGEPAWTAGDGTHGYSSGHLTNIGDVPQVLFTSDVGVQSFSPDTGALFWEHRWPISTNPRCIQPLVPDTSSVLIGTAGGKGTRRLSIHKENGAWRVEEQWTTRGFRPYFNDFVYHQGHCYGYDGRRFTCIDAATGERKWKGDSFGGQVLLLPDMNVLLVLSEKGNVVLLESTHEGQNKIAEFRALHSKTWNHPVIANGKLFVRNSEEAVCYQLSS